MTWEAWYTLGVIALVFVALIRDWGPADGVLLGGSLLVGIAGIITPYEVFSGLVNPGTLTIAALFIVAAAMRETGSLESIGQWVFGNARTEQSGLLRMVAPVSAMSAFFNNTPIVAMLMPVVNDWCKKYGISPSRMLMPLSFIAILGGTCTLIGTSTNLAVNGLIQEAIQVAGDAPEGLAPLRLFDMAYVGVPMVGVGCLYLLLIGRRLLPDRKDIKEKLAESPREYLADMQIQAGCKLIGKGVEEASLRHLPGLFLVEIVRNDKIITPVGPDEVMEESDILTFSGVVDTIVDLERIQGLVPVADEGYEVQAALRRGKYLCEAVISPRSPFIGKNIREANFRGVYTAAVIAVHRGGERIRGRIGDIVLRAGDTLLLQAGERFASVHQNNPDFYLVSTVEDARPVRHDRAIVCNALLVLLVVLMASNTIEIVYAAFIVAGLMVATRCIPTTAARKSIDWQTIVTIGAAFGLGHALESSGAAREIAIFFVRVAGEDHPHLMLFLLYGLTSIFAAMISSKASAVLMFPIALATAAAIGVSPQPFVLAIMYAAAATFATPLGYPTNLMVYGPGGYRFTDFARVGLPMSVILMVLAGLLIPVFWQF